MRSVGRVSFLELLKLGTARHRARSFLLGEKFRWIDYKQASSKMSSHVSNRDKWFERSVGIVERYFQGVSHGVEFYSCEENEIQKFKIEGKIDVLHVIPKSDSTSPPFIILKLSFHLVLWISVTTSFLHYSSYQELIDLI